MSRTAMDGILMAIVLGTITHFTRPDGFGLLVIIIGLCAAYLVIEMMTSRRYATTSPLSRLALS